jgi:hypothetical protein
MHHVLWQEKECLSPPYSQAQSPPFSKEKLYSVRCPSDKISEDVKDILPDTQFTEVSEKTDNMSKTSYQIPCQSASTAENDFSKNNGNYSIETVSSDSAELDHRRHLKYMDILEDEYNCYDQTYSKTRKECEDTKDVYGNEKEVGVWDRRCKKDAECPFFQKNKNYPNRRGGCIDGLCELPVNAKRTSYRTYDTQDPRRKPFCYNCSGSEGNCCEDQKKNSGHSFLVSPDYVFPLDYIKRQEYKHILNSRKMNV